MSWLSEALGNEDRKRLAAEAQAQADRIRQQEDERQANIKTGQANIDEAFKQFNPEFFQKFQDTYTGAFTPQIREQYNVALDKLKAVLAGRGTAQSTIGANAFGGLLRKRSDAEAEIGGQAADAANDLRGKIDAAKGSLYALNLGAADPALASAQAAGQAASFAAPRQYGALGDIFGGFMNTFNTANRADANSLNPQLPWNTFASGRGSAIFG
jgi:hypothetical protein